MRCMRARPHEWVHGGQQVQRRSASASSPSLCHSPCRACAHPRRRPSSSPAPHGRRPQTSACADDLPSPKSAGRRSQLHGTLGDPARCQSPGAGTNSRSPRSKHAPRSLPADPRRAGWSRAPTFAMAGSRPRTRRAARCPTRLERRLRRPSVQIARRHGCSPTTCMGSTACQLLMLTHSVSLRADWAGITPIARGSRCRGWGPGTSFAQD